MQNLYTYRSGVIFALITAVSLGSITTQAKIYYAESGNAMTLMLARFFVSSLVFALYLLIRRQSFDVNASERGGVFQVGAVWSGAMILYLLSVETINVSLAVLILYAYPLLVLLYAITARQLPASWRLIILFLLAFTGLYLALSTGEVELNATGLIFASLASIGAAFTFIKGARVAPKLKPIVMSFWVNLVGLVMILPLVYSSFASGVSNKGLTALGIATALYVIAIFCQFQALSRLPATMAALILNFEPVVSILLAVIILREAIGPWQWVGIALVISVLIASILMGQSQGGEKHPG